MTRATDAYAALTAAMEQRAPACQDDARFLDAAAAPVVQLSVTPWMTNSGPSWMLSTFSGMVGMRSCATVSGP